VNKERNSAAVDKWANPKARHVFRIRRVQESATLEYSPSFLYGAGGGRRDRFGHTRASRDPPVQHALRNGELDRAKLGQAAGFKFESGAGVMLRDLFGVGQPALSAFERARQ
jgi:hypothetical protein